MTVRTFYKKLRRKLWDACLKNVVRGTYLAVQQKKYLNQIGVGKSCRTIVFLVPGRNEVNGGGVMSVFFIARETERLKALHEADVFVCSLPGGPTLLRNTKFPNDQIIVDYDLLLSKFEKGADVLVHIPEIFVPRFLHCERKKLESSELHWHFNILLQNIDLAPRREDVDLLSKFGPTTVTTAHEAYSGIETQKALGCAIHHLSAWTSLEPYERKAFVDRENVFVISPDFYEGKREILAELKRRLPDFRFVTVKRMTYFDYRKLIATAKFSLTFGEGLDGYYTEMIFGGGIGCAVYNERFFTKCFSELPFVYPSWEALLSRLPDDVRAVNSIDKFDLSNEAPYRLLSSMYSPEISRAKIKSYYSANFLPKK